MINRQPALGRRKFLKTSASGSFLILTLPVLRLFGRLGISKEISKVSPDRMPEMARKYGPEFGGREAIRNIQIQRGGENGGI